MIVGKVTILFVAALAAFGVSFVVAGALAHLLAGPWRRSADAHWTERARLAYAPGVVLLYLMALLPALLGMVADISFSLGKADNRNDWAAFSAVCVASLLGILLARCRWLQLMWGSRLTLRSYISGCLVLWFVTLPSFLVCLIAFVCLPQKFDHAAVTGLGIACLALVAVGFGGGLWVLRLLRMAKPAPSWLAEMVEIMARETKTSFRAPVWELQSPYANAYAWTTARCVGFTSTLLQAMDRNQVQSVAAHELAHLAEPSWVRWVRFAHMFGYLLAVPVARYGGDRGSIIAWFLFAGNFLWYKRFTRHFEVRADRIQNETLASETAYLGAMVTLHRTNMLPAVLPGKTTHPHLYDRLLAAGIQPDFPRRAPPSNAKPFIVALIAAVATATVLLVGVVVILALIGVINHK